MRLVLVLVSFLVEVFRSFGSDVLLSACKKYCTGSTYPKNLWLMIVFCLCRPVF